MGKKKKFKSNLAFHIAGSDRIDMRKRTIIRTSNGNVTLKGSNSHLSPNTHKFSSSSIYFEFHYKKIAGYTVYLYVFNIKRHPVFFLRQ